MHQKLLILPVAFQIARYFSSVSFLYFGTKCIFSKKMVLEFDRLHLPQFRLLNGALQILGAIGLILGGLWLPVFYLSAGGLALQMLVGFIVRIKLRDPLTKVLPALFFFVLNTYLVFVIGLKS
jgi:hypothetical protein